MDQPSSERRSRLAVAGTLRKGRLNGPGSNSLPLRLSGNLRLPERRMSTGRDRIPGPRLPARQRFCAVRLLESWLHKRRVRARWPAICFEGVWAGAGAGAPARLLEEWDPGPVQIGIHQSPAITSGVLLQAAVLKATSSGAMYPFCLPAPAMNRQAPRRATNHLDEYSTNVRARQEVRMAFRAGCGYTVAKAACPQLWLRVPPWSEVRLPQRLRFFDARRSAIADFALARCGSRASKSHGCTQLRHHSCLLYLLRLPSAAAFTCPNERCLLD